MKKLFTLFNMMNNNILELAKEIEEKIIDHRRKVHSFAEIEFENPLTFAYVIDVLSDLGYKPIRCGKSGISATVGKGSGKVVLLRADMDALPIKEETGLKFAAKNGNMHACGHDMHTAMLLGAAEILKRLEGEIGGTIKLMFQPAEEILIGAKDMIDSGILLDPQVNCALMIHVIADPMVPSGSVFLPFKGIAAPSADYFKLTVHGKSAHGSVPYRGIDALSVASRILLGYEEIVARELKPTDNVVISIGCLHAGDAPNIIANKAILEGTVRTYKENVRVHVKNRMKKISSNISSAYRCKCFLEFTSGCPTLINDAAVTDKATDALVKGLRLNKVLTPKSEGGGSEDFAYISQSVPSVMIGISAGKASSVLHTSTVDFDESVLTLGAAIYSQVGLELMK